MHSLKVSAEMFGAPVLKVNTSVDRVRLVVGSQIEINIQFILQPYQNETFEAHLGNKKLC